MPPRVPFDCAMSDHLLGSGCRESWASEVNLNYNPSKSTEFQWEKIAREEREDNRRYNCSRKIEIMFLGYKNKNKRDIPETM